MKKHQLEICASGIGSVIAAAEGGADRIELCSGLSEGGVTPSAGLILNAMRINGIKVNVLIRPRGGDFLYSEPEISTMIHDIEFCRESGVNGIVIGALDSNGNIDTAVCRRLIDAAGNLRITFHRAFDMCCDEAKALEDIIELGCDLILTSGLACDAIKGCNKIAHLKKLAGERIKIMACGGIDASNAEIILKNSYADDLHASAKASVASMMKFRRQDVKMGDPEFDEYSHLASSVIKIKSIVHSIKKYENGNI